MLQDLLSRRNLRESGAQARRSQTLRDQQPMGDPILPHGHVVRHADVHPEGHIQTAAFVAEQTSVLLGQITPQAMPGNGYTDLLSIVGIER